MQINVLVVVRTVASVQMQTHATSVLMASFKKALHVLVAMFQDAKYAIKK
jgi:hypothetical protein